MAPKSMDMAWMVVSDIKQALKFYTETVGLKLCEFNEEYGWAELSARDSGCRLGIAQMQPQSVDGVSPGQNAVMTLTVDNIENVVAELGKKGTKFVGGIQEIPGHVKLQTVSDQDGNKFQLVELLYKKHSCCSC